MNNTSSTYQVQDQPLMTRPGPFQAYAVTKSTLTLNKRQTLTHLLVVAHGRRRDESNIEICELATLLRNSSVVLAYLISVRRHVMTDIPEQVRQVSADVPNIKIKIAPHLGASQKIDELLVGQAISAYY